MKALVLALVCLGACDGPARPVDAEASGPQTTTAASTTSGAPAPVASASAPAEPSATAAAVGSAVSGCGERGRPDCPMQGWMKSTMAMAMASGDNAQIAAALRTIARKVPAGGGWFRWAEMAEAGAKSAEAGDAAGVRESCRQCHALHQGRYRRTQRAADF